MNQLTLTDMLVTAAATLTVIITLAAEARLLARAERNNPGRDSAMSLITLAASAVILVSMLISLLAWRATASG